MTSQPKNEMRRWIPWIMGGLLAWGALLGLGAFLFGGNHALLRGLIVFVCALGFVEFWWLMLIARERRINRLAAKDEK